MITDRTQEDVTSKTAKGFYNTTDMNRVEAKVQELSDIFVGAGYLSNPVTKLDWSISDIPNYSDLQRYFGNIADLRAKIQVFDDTPPTPMSAETDYEFVPLDYEMANDAEKILVDLEVLLNYITSPLYYKASGNTNVVSGGSSPWWRAAKVNSPSALIAAVIQELEAYTWAELPDTIASETEAVSAIQDIVDGIVPSTMTAVVTAVSYTNNYGQTGELVFVMAVTYSGVSESTGNLSVEIENNGAIAEILAAIQGNGTAYVDTEYYPGRQSTKLEISFSDENTTYTAVVAGARSSELLQSTSLFYHADTTKLRKLWCGSNNTYTDALGVGTINEIVCENGAMTVNDVYYPSVTAAQDVRTYSMYIFAENSNGAGYFSKCVIYENVTAWENEEVVFKGVPVRRLSDGLVTYYDENRRIFCNVFGEGSLIAIEKENPEYIYA